MSGATALHILDMLVESITGSVEAIAREMT
jgi:hypothetical protein